MFAGLFLAVSSCFWFFLFVCGCFRLLLVSRFVSDCFLSLLVVSGSFLVVSFFFLVASGCFVAFLIVPDCFCLFLLVSCCMWLFQVVLNVQLFLIAFCF